MDSSVVQRHPDLIDSISIEPRLTSSQKMNTNPVVVPDGEASADLIETQYINLHRLPENLQKVQLVSDPLSSDLLSQQVVELAASNEFIAPVGGQYYDDEFLHQDMTEEDRRLAAALVAVQLVHQQKHSMLAPDLLKSSTLPTLTTIQNVPNDKQPSVTTTMVTSYLQAFDEEETVPQQLLDTTQNSDRILKIYQPQTVSTAPLNVNTSTTTSLSDMRLPALPPLKKVLSNPTMLRTRYDRSINEQVPEVINEKELILRPHRKLEKNEINSDNSGDQLEIDGDSDYEGDCNMKSSKRSLPHKKRIPRKLKSQQSKNVHLPSKRMSMFACEICSFQSNHQVRFFEHLKGHYEPSVVQVTDELQQQENFLDYNGTAPNQDPIIQESFSIKEDPAEASASNITCNQCGRTFRRQKAYEMHVATAHPPIEEFSEPEDMMEGIRHVVNIQSESDEKDGNWRSSDDLDNITPDIVLETKPAVEQISDDLQDSGSEKGKKRKKAVQCPHCSKTFTHRNSLLYHVRSHTGRRPHQCDVCGKGFFAANALRVHMRMHSGDKPYTCTVCGRNFRQWGDLKYHMTSLHSDTKQYQCEFCGKDFARKYSLIVHRRIHTGEKNYVCEYCRKSFRASSYLVNHRRIHTGEKPYKCDVCHKPFRVKSDMKRHLNTHNKARADSLVPVVPVAPPSPETIIPDAHDTDDLLNDHSLPLNLNMRQEDSTDDLTSYSRDPLSRDNTVYVWIPTTGESILSD